MKKRLSSIKDQNENKKSSFYLRSKSKKADTVKIAANPMRNSQKMNNRYSSSKKIKIEAVDSGKINNNVKSTNIPAKNTSQSHITITSVDIDYAKLLDEDKKKLEEIKEQIALKKKKLEEIKKCKRTNSFKEKKVRRK